jgi:murein DD-endopeptidase MepM/ murein hydrolase activator NlpD
MPVDRVPNWGAMRTAREWSRSYDDIDASEFVPLPPYDLALVETPVDTLADKRTRENTAILTAKLTYSTRYYGTYDLDAGEFSGEHPGIDIKLPLGMPVGAIGGGRVLAVREDDRFGIHVLIAHEVDGQRLVSIYAHLSEATVREAQDVMAGEEVGKVGMTGQTVAPHLHLQIDLDDGTKGHTPFVTEEVLTPAQAARHTLHPVAFIEAQQGGGGAVVTRQRAEERL